tara:strand:+ start:1721 stop:1942 length:222 start_codon:yes stop_codon:yes gene_type:complete
MSNYEISTFVLGAQYRNIILIEHHSKLPSYCYWDSFSIEKESLKDRYNWWNNIDTTKYINIREKWKNIYQDKK